MKRKKGGKTAPRMGLAVEPSAAEQEVKEERTKATVKKVLHTYKDAGCATTMRRKFQPPTH